MAAETITVPAAYVQSMRYHLGDGMAGFGETLSNAWDSDPELLPKLEKAVEGVRRYKAAIDQLGWEGDGEDDKTISVESDDLAVALDQMATYTADDLRDAKRDERVDLAEKLRWACIELRKIDAKPEGGWRPEHDE